MTTTQADAEVTRILTLFPLLPEPPSVFPAWRRLVTAAQVSGKPTHDARLMAVADVNGMAQLLTFNTGDFTRFVALTPTVQVVDPNTI